MRLGFRRKPAEVAPLRRAITGRRSRRAARAAAEAVPSLIHFDSASYDSDRRIGAQLFMPDGSILQTRVEMPAELRGHWSLGSYALLPRADDRIAGVGLDHPRSRENRAVSEAAARRRALDQPW